MNMLYLFLSLLCGIYGALAILRIFYRSVTDKLSLIISGKGKSNGRKL